MPNAYSLSRRKGMYGKCILVGCIVLIVLAIVGSIAAYFGIKKGLNYVVQEYTETVPRELPKLSSSASEIQDVCNRVDAFKNAFEENGPVQPLILSERDINLLINNYPDWKELAGKVNISLIGETIKGEVSIPLEGMGKATKGRYLNGTAVIRIELEAQRLVVFIDSLEMRGKTLPDAFMDGFRSQNLAKDANNDPELSKLIKKLESIKVEDGKLFIIPKN